MLFLTHLGEQPIQPLGEYTEIKWEAVIDRITSAAVPRQMERVPAGAIFSPLELVYNIYGPGDEVRKALPQVFVALQLLEDDYLGGSGSRGYGKVKFEALEISCKRRVSQNGQEGGRYQEVGRKSYNCLENILADENFETWILEQIPSAG